MEVETITREHLYDLVWSTPLSRLAGKYQITDNDLRKMCTRMEIPLPRSGHWQKVLHGRSPKKPPLPVNYSGDNTVTLEVVSADSPKRRGTVGQVNDQKVLISDDLKQKLSSKQKPTRPDPLIVATRAIHEASRKKNWDSPVFNKYPDRLSITTSDALFEKGLSFLDHLMKAMRARNHDLGCRNHKTVARLFEEEIEIRLWEKNRMIREVKDNWPTTTYEPTGLLCFGAKVFIHDKTWTDKNKSLADQLPEIIAYLELKGNELIEDRRKSMLAAERREAERKQRIEFEQRRDEELIKFKSLLFSVSRWQQLRLIREYIDEVESKGPNSSEQADWIAWARKKADWYDPQINANDELLNEVNMETLQPERRY